LKYRVVKAKTGCIHYREFLTVDGVLLPECELHDLHCEKCKDLKK
jgi:hypothetical protein